MTAAKSFVVSPDCLRLGLRAGAVLLRDLHITTSSPALRAEIAEEIAVLRARYPDPTEVRSAPEIEPFRDIIRKVGVNPRREQPSVERLVQYALKRGDLPAVNNLVDAYNLVSVRWFCSLGAHDLDRLALPAELRLLTGREAFTPLGRDEQVAVVAGEFGYVDAQDRLLCRLDLLQAEFSKVTMTTVNALLIVEGTAAHEPQTLQRAIVDVIMLVQRYCGGTAEVVAQPFV
jgi:DNA/RNA-binding domain of Phe-tRNA-synthetase-like protein